MNEQHAQLCGSDEWAEYIQTEVLPRLIEGVDLGAAMLEIGPGPGATTDWLRHRVEQLTAVEIDEVAAAKLQQRFSESNVTIINASAAALEFPDNHFDSAGSFTMLHHIPTPQLQNQVLAEILRVLKPGGVLIASDSLPSSGLHDFHEGDIYNPIEPATLIGRLQTIGFAEMTVRVGDQLSFMACKPSEVDASAA